jgi:hypothetical protein
VSYALALARLLSRLAPFLGRRCDPLNERVRFWVALDVRGEPKAEIVGCQPAAKPFFDAGDAQVVIPAAATDPTLNDRLDDPVFAGMPEGVSALPSV